jgi:hypothetical protein
VGVVDDLARAIVEVDPQGQLDDATIARELAVEPCGVSLADEPRGKLLLEVCVRDGVLGRHEEP